MERFLNIKICSTLFENKFEINFINKNIHAILDEVSDNFDEVDKEKQKWIDTLIFLITNPKLKNVQFPIKKRNTDTGIYFCTQVSRCKDIELNIKKYSDSNYIINGLDFSTFKHKTGGYGGTHKLAGTALKNFYSSYIQKLDDLKEILQGVYTKFVKSLHDYNNEINKIVNYVSNLDMITTKAYISKKYKYCKPIIDNNAQKAFIQIKDIRHPLIEHIQTDEIYQTNDVSIGKNNNGMLIYGTNGVGKSSFNKAVGISIILAQAGMFVPCSEFIYKPYTAIYTRILGNDNLFKGLSTFTVEMSEVCEFINKCDENCMIIGDEVCSGTETDSACAIFQEVLLWLNKNNSSYIFATHFHQLTTRDEIISLEKLDIKHMSVENINGVLYYTRKLEDGPGENMYGIEVTKSFEFPEEFIKKCEKTRNKYNNKVGGILNKKKSKYNSKTLKRKTCEFCKIRESEEIHHLSRQEDADKDNYINTFHKNHTANLSNVCKTCHNYFTINRIVHKRIKSSNGYKLIEMKQESNSIKLIINE